MKTLSVDNKHNQLVFETGLFELSLKPLKSYDITVALLSAIVIFELLLINKARILPLFCLTLTM